MSANAKPVGYTDVEVRSYLPSGWGIVPGARGAWNAKARKWTLEVYDGADHVWTLEVDGEAASRGDRFEAIKEAVRRLNRNALGRKSILTG
jgi:hypothetical protein